MSAAYRIWRDHQGVWHGEHSGLGVTVTARSHVACRRKLKLCEFLLSVRRKRPAVGAGEAK